MRMSARSEANVVHRWILDGVIGYSTAEERRTEVNEALGWLPDVRFSPFFLLMLLPCVEAEIR